MRLISWSTPSRDGSPLSGAKMSQLTTTSERRNPSRTSVTSDPGGGYCGGRRGRLEIGAGRVGPEPELHRAVLDPPPADTRQPLGPGERIVGDGGVHPPAETRRHRRLRV